MQNIKILNSKVIKIHNIWHLSEYLLIVVNIPFFVSVDNMSNKDKFELKDDEQKVLDQLKSNSNKSINKIAKNCGF